jgi:hypothetical protein
MLARLLVVLVVALVAAPAAAAAPSNLHGFLLRSSESPSPHVFARTPSFAWSQVRGATRYEFQLSTSRRFTENAVVWERSSLRVPFATVPITLPWMSGEPYSWYARVRAWLSNRVTGWSKPYGFNLVPPSAPQSLSGGPANPHPGLIRWTPVAGATAYEFTFVYAPGSGVTRTWTSPTTAADLREYYLFHNQVDSDGWTPVRWRVRAVRVVSGNPQNDLPAVTYGPSSPTYTTIEPDLDTASQLALGGTISRAGSSTVTGSGAHALMPGFWWNGSLSLDGEGTDTCTSGTALGSVMTTDVTCPLFHVYVFSDRNCVNRVYTSDLVGSPAFVPRLERPFDLPKDLAELSEAADAILGNADGSGEGLVYDFSDRKVYAAGTGPGASGSGRKSGLWDSDFAGGRWWWTAVPAVPYLNDNDRIEYRDVELPQDRCEAGEVQGFRKTSEPVIENQNAIPYVSGRAGDGSVRPARARRPSFFEHVIVAWKPAPGARRYEIEWSRTASPWRPTVERVTAGNAAQFKLAPGVWYYRVRGLDPTVPGTKQGMAWSSAQYVRIRPRTFVVG